MAAGIRQLEVLLAGCSRPWFMFAAMQIPRTHIVLVLPRLAVAVS